MPDYFFVYPAYLTKSSSRAKGRRVPAPIAVGEVTLDQIVTAARGLGFQAKAEPEKQYPRQFYTYAGRVRVTKHGSVTKGEFLRRLVQELRKRTGGNGEG